MRLLTVALTLLVASTTLADRPVDERPKETYRAGDDVEVTSDAQVAVGAQVLGTARKGEKYSVFQVRGDWLAVEFNGKSGWIKANAVKKAPAPPAPPVLKPGKTFGKGEFNNAVAPRRPERGERYALLVGVREYDATELNSLKHTEDDIDGLAALLPGLGYAADNTAVLTQARGARKASRTPTAANIRRQLELILSEASKDDTVVVALAGHGVQFQGDKDAYFCPSDARLDDKATLIQLAEVYQALEGCRATAKVLLVDACRNDPQSELSRSRRTVKLESVSRPQSAEPPGGVSALFSCAAGQKAFEHPDLKHGVFFHFVIEGLKGRADGDGDGEVSLAELEEFTGKQVQKFVRNELQQTQSPERRGASTRISLGRVAVAPAPKD